MSQPPPNPPPILAYDSPTAAPPGTGAYLLGSAAYSRMRRRVLRRLVIVNVLVALFLAVMIGYPLLHLPPGTHALSTHTWIALLLPAVLLPALTAVSIVRTLRRIRRDCESFHIFLGPDTVTRRGLGLADLVLHRQDVTRIDALPTGDIVLRTAKSPVFITIPASIERLDEIRSHLATWQPLQPRNARPLWRTIATLCGLGATLAAMITVWLLPLHWVSLLLCPALLATLTWYVIATQHNPHLTVRTKMMAWIVILPMFSIIGIFLTNLATRLHWHSPGLSP